MLLLHCTAIKLQIAWVMSWFESRHLSRIPQKGHTNATLERKAQKRSTKLIESPKRSTKLSENPKRSTKWKVDSNHWVMTWFESICQMVFLSHESIWVDLSPELIWFKVFWKLFESWVDLNQISEIHFELIHWAYLNQFLYSDCESWVESNQKFLRLNWMD